MEDDAPVFHGFGEEYDQKIDLLYFKGMFQDKMLIYEDDHVQLGCIRSVSMEWR